MTVTLVLAVAIVIALSFLLRNSERRVYEQLIAELQRERDHARDEAAAFRGILIPKLAKVEGAAGDAGVTPKPPQPLTARNPAPAASPTPAKPYNPIFDKRLPFRIRFKAALKASNTKQLKTDALASALANQKPVQEKSNA